MLNPVRVGELLGKLELVSGQQPGIDVPGSSRSWVSTESRSGCRRKPTRPPVKRATGGLLTLLTTDKGINVLPRPESGSTGGARSLPGAASATVAYGRLFYTLGKQVHVFGLKSGVDRTLLIVPGESRYVAAGSFGLALANNTSKGTSVYRIPWRVIDALLPAG